MATPFPGSASTVCLWMCGDFREKCPPNSGKMNPKVRAFMGFPTKNRTASLMLKSELYPPWNKQQTPLKFNGWKIHFLSGSPMFGAYVSFREGRWFLIICMFFCPQVTSCLVGLIFPLDSKGWSFIVLHTKHTLQGRRGLFRWRGASVFQEVFSKFETLVSICIRT